MIGNNLPDTLSLSLKTQSTKKQNDFPVFISPMVWNKCVNLHFELKHFKELHNDQEYNCPTTYRAGAAVVSTITSSVFCNKFLSKNNNISHSAPSISLFWTHEQRTTGRQR